MVDAHAFKPHPELKLLPPPPTMLKENQFVFVAPMYGREEANTSANKGNEHSHFVLLPTALNETVEQMGKTASHATLTSLETAGIPLKPVCRLQWQKKKSEVTVSLFLE